MDCGRKPADGAAAVPLVGAWMGAKALACDTPKQLGRGWSGASRAKTSATPVGLSERAAPQPEPGLASHKKSGRYSLASWLCPPHDPLPQLSKCAGGAGSRST